MHQPCTSRQQIHVHVHLGNDHRRKAKIHLGNGAYRKQMHLGNGALRTSYSESTIHLGNGKQRTDYRLRPPNTYRQSVEIKIIDKGV